MSAIVTPAELFLELTKDERWNDIDDLVQKLDDANFWNEEHLKQAATAFKKNFVRRLARSIKDDNGWPIFASVVVSEVDGTRKHVYKQETLFDVADYEQVVLYHAERGRHHIQMANGYAKRASSKFGTQMPLPFPTVG